MTTATDGAPTGVASGTPQSTPLRSLPAHPDPREAARAALLRRLAADRLRDLRDDGVSGAYVARMYGVDRAALDEMARILGVGT
jgi:hypothetical protein